MSNTDHEDQLDAEERFLIDQIRTLQLEYEKAAKPYVERLVLIRSLRPAPRFMLSVEQAQMFAAIAKAEGQQ